MNKLLALAAVVVVLSMGWTATTVMGAEPIVIGLPTSLTSIEGKESLRTVQMAVDEINAKGGVKVGKTKRPLKIESIDLRDSSPGVPVSEALLGLEKIITEKKPVALVVGPFRSEALLPGMDIMSKYKFLCWEPSPCRPNRKQWSKRIQKITRTSSVFPLTPNTWWDICRAIWEL